MYMWNRTSKSLVSLIPATLYFYHAVATTNHLSGRDAVIGAHSPAVYHFTHFRPNSAGESFRGGGAKEGGEIADKNLNLDHIIYRVSIGSLLATTHGTHDVREGRHYPAISSFHGLNMRCPM